MSFVTQGSIPEVLETNANDSLTERTQCLSDIQDLGPPDMVHLIKHNPSTKTEIGTYLYYTGSDVSNSACVAALLHSIADIIGETPQVWFGKHKPWKVQEATYCAYNAFSKLDTRVNVHFPGGVSSSMLDAEGNPVIEKDRYWLETAVSSVVRALISADDDEADFSSIVEIRKINPFPNEETITIFLKGCEDLFFEGPKLGCAPTIQLPTLASNYLVDAFMIAVSITGKYQEGLEILTRLAHKEPSVSYLIAKLHFMSSHEVDGIAALYETSRERPLDSNLLMTQAEFCYEKGRFDLALPVAIRAVNSSPSAFLPWALLVKVYIATGNYEQALLTLNSCPIVTHKDKYHLRRVTIPPTSNLHLPLPVDVTLPEVSSLNSQDVANEHKEVDQTLLNLPAGNLKSTFAIAYGLLTEIVRKTGWEALLKFRAKVFVMEEEYRKEKSESSTTLATNGNVEAANGGSETPKEDYRKKRLCERWLDNLFMLLYEDLRVYTMYRAELVHFTAQQMEFKKSTLEWELLGLVSSRLCHQKEAAEAYNLALSGRFSVRSSKKLLGYYQGEKKRIKRIESGQKKKDEGSMTSEEIAKYKQTLQKKILDLVVKLSIWNHRWYSEFSPMLLDALASMIDDAGVLKVESEIRANYATETNGVFELISDSLEFLKTHHFYRPDE
ncbi:unnamed protein product [Kuraishia capsulata CBS 1993]|uniref:Uncharacterized protein n=1 Tax=Kuraishia capsulata CBS 1993 TaxID=1382522 RepID=W6MI39_9ASCO|nr:uncharacterized protein KUCA_T00001488001 [Kuraishia capsulata CBS 1993]CDK25518.1 unnamed protein product [Kuraishia capsulata CBS 1993]